MNKLLFNYYTINIFVLVLGVITPILLVYFFLNSKIVDTNKNDLSINNVVLAPVVQNSEVLKAVNAKNSASPNFGDGLLKSKILDFYKRESKNYSIVVKNDVLEGNKNLVIYVGDSVSIKNLSDNLVDISGTKGWGFEGVQKNSIFIQEFFILGKYEYTIYPMGWSGVIEVKEPTM